MSSLFRRWFFPAVLACVVPWTAGCTENVLVGSEGDGGHGSAGASGCDGSDGGEPWTDPTCDVGPIAGVVSTIAMRTEGYGPLEIEINSAAGTCENRHFVPDGCSNAWRVRIDLFPQPGAVGTYPIGPSGVFGRVYARTVGDAGECANLDHDLSGTLTVTQIDEHEVRGSICGSGEHDGTFTASVCCAACKGTGVACSSNGECCNGYCGSGTCDP